MVNQDLIVETISDGTKMAQNQPRELRWAMSGIKRRAILAYSKIIDFLCGKQFTGQWNDATRWRPYALSRNN